MKTSRRAAHALALALFGVLFLAACAGAEPQDRTFDITITGVDVQPAVVKINQDDTVTFNITSEHPFMFHIHGYNIGKQVSPGETAVMTFEANATGRFTLGLHGEMPEMAALPDAPDESTEADDSTVHEIDGWLEVQPR